MRTKILISAAAMIAAAASFTPPATAAALPAPNATCVDGNYQDGVDSRYGATYCASAVNRAGYGAQVYSNEAALGAVEQEAKNAIFGHTGHALVVCSDRAGNNCTAAASLFAPTGDGKISSLVGDPQYLTLQGNVDLCSNGVLIGQALDKGCRTYNITQYPYEQTMERFNLALFQSCDSAHDGVGGYSSLVTEATKVGTAIGFLKAIYAVGGPGSNLGSDAFSRRFWSDTANGASYRTATVNAVNAAGGTRYNFAYYVIKQAANAQTGLYPASFNTPGA